MITQYFPTAQLVFMQDASTLSQEIPILEASEAVVNQLKNGHKQIPIILMGHSRGGALAALSAMKEPSRVTAVVLLDPVDDNSMTLWNSLSTRRCEGNPLPPFFIVSTPYGGRSSYYKKAIFTSACAPEGRNAAAIWSAFRSCEQNVGLLVKFPELGHFQLFHTDISESSSFANICATNDRLSYDRISSYKILLFSMVFRFLELLESDALDAGLESLVSKEMASSTQFVELNVEWEKT